jgi:hypothetical protein
MAGAPRGDRRGARGRRRWDLQATGSARATSGPGHGPGTGRGGPARARHGAPGTARARAGDVAGDPARTVAGPLQAYGGLAVQQIENPTREASASSRESRV